MRVVKGAAGGVRTCGAAPRGGGVVGVLLVDPFAPLSVGAWLSFGAVGAILMLLTGRIRSGSNGLVAKCREFLTLQWAVTLGLVPLAVALARRDGAGMAPAGTRQGALQRFAWVWLGTAAGLTVLRPDLPAWPALLMGSLGSLVLVRATEVALQQAGQRPRIDNTVWFSAWAAQAAVLATLLAPLLADGGPALALLAAQFWLAAVAHWAWHLQPSLLRLPARPR